jgi:quercetin dioxygenase-like cupin family protein
LSKKSGAAVIHRPPIRQYRQNSTLAQCALAKTGEEPDANKGVLAMTYRHLSGAVALAILLGAAAAAQGTDQHKIISATEITWAPGPGSIPPGAQAAVLYGDPSKEGLFALRLKLPKGYTIPPHTHPKPEVVTVITGTFRLGMGDKPDKDKAQALPAGSFFALSPGMAHFAFADEDTVIQLNSMGPWGLTYVNAADDPRRKTQ